MTGAIRQISGAGEVREIDREIVLGRQGDLTVTDDEASRRHAAVRPVAEGVEVEDLGSANGTFLDGTRVEGKVTVTQNATLRIGTTEFRIEVSLPQATKIASTVPPETTAVRRVRLPEPEGTVVRPVQPHTPEATPPAADAAAPGERAADRGPNPRVLIPAGIAALIVLVVLGVVLLGGSSNKKTPVAAIRPDCGKYAPHLINDGFPEPRMVFSHNGVLDYTLKASTTTITVAGHRWPAMAYDGSIPAPTLVFCPGDQVTLHLINDLPLQTNLHLHGLHVSPSGDSDNIFVDIHPFEEHTYHYQIPLDQSSGTFWYHPHYHPFVQPEVESGLAGAILVEGSLDDQFPNIPQRLMVIQGGREVLGPPIKLPPKIAAKLKPPPLAGPPVLIVNGVHDPVVKIQPGQLQRWRLVNATSDRMLKLAIPGVTFEELALDGITLHNMVPQTQLTIGPGSRIDVLVRGPASGTYPFVSEPFQKCFKSCLDPFAGEGQSGAPDPGETLMTVQSSGATADDPLPTGQLAYPKWLGDLRHAHVDVYRTLYFSRVQNLNVGTIKFPLNGRTYNPNQVDVTMKLNSVEQWTLANPITGTDDEWHTFHIHINPFQVISINGHPLKYVLWEDNVNLPPGSSIVIRMRPTDFTGKFVFHCHLLFHEDNGMMGVVQVLANPTTAQVNTDRVMYMVPPDGRELKALLAAANSGRATSWNPAGKWSIYELYCHPLGLTTA
ncbi:MAG: multicopper oxidase domain-containing protein [Solirubrobacteraceae bacterium]